MRSLLILSGIIGCQAVFKPNNRDELKAAVGTCSHGGYPCTGCLQQSSRTGNCGSFTSQNVPAGQGSGTYGPMNTWDVSLVTDMSTLFLYADKFNADISGWDVSSVTTMYIMFGQAKVFNGDLSNWDTSKVTNMGDLFTTANGFVGTGLENWDTSQVTNMYAMFNKAYVFNADISGWDTSSLAGSMNYMFLHASQMTSDLSAWDISGVTSTQSWTSGISAWSSDISQCTMTPIAGHLTDEQQPYNGCVICATEPCDNSMECKKSWYIWNSDPALDGTANPNEEKKSFICDKDCDPGNYKDWVSGVKVPFDASKRTFCTLCPLGTYQDQPNQLSCETCPSGRSTTVLGSTLKTECLNATQIRNQFLEIRDPALVPAYNIANSCVE